MSRRDPRTIFFRLLKTPIDDKGNALAAQIAALNANSPPLAGEGQGEGFFTLDPADLALIPNSPFAYWVGDSIRQLFVELPSVEESGISVQHGASTKRDFRFLRLWWEVDPDSIDRNLRWAPFAKGGQYSPYYSDVHLLVNWENDAQEIHEYLVERYPYLKGNTGWVLHPENTYFRPGLTWPRRTGGFSVRVLPRGCIFADKGPTAFVPDNDPDELMALLTLMNSAAFEMLVRVQLARTELAQSYEVGLIQHTPVPALTPHATRHTLAALAREAHDLQRDRDRTDETTHAFTLPGLVQNREADSLLQASLALEAEEQAAQARLDAIQAEIDEIVFDLYGLSQADRALVREEMGQPETWNLEPETPEEDDENEIAPPEDLPARVQNLLMWCVGVAFGRWDVRMALDPTLLPSLQGPFDPLPRCAPGTLVGPDGLPPAQAVDIAPKAWLRARENVLRIPSSPLPVEATRAGTDQPETSNLKPQTPYPLPIAWDGILVDDPTHRSDVVTRVRGVLTLLWGDRAGAIEREACDILGFESLRDYFRDPRKGFFAFHVQRYSKSRRKAPVYWLLQSERRNYGIWLYIHRLRPDALFVAGRDYADAKVALEEARTQELRQGLDVLNGSARRRRERGIERQQRLVAEVTEFRDRLDCVALLNLPPDLNDGVTISIAPLWELVPWKEAQRTWEKLVAGEYPWSTMRQQMQKQGLVKA
jgi:hypothetical protein